VPFAIVCDAGQDADHRGMNLARLIRLARVDLGAEFEEVSANPAFLKRAGVPPAIASRLGGTKHLLGMSGGLPQNHATLLLVRYPRGPRNTDGDPWLARTHTWLLFIKATVTGDEPLDVLNYAAAHPAFPNETTLDQVFEEPQWESYRQLGEHIGEQFFI
jgi:hypothetical protein